MAKTVGPLMSMDASGAFGGTMVFSKWKGRNYVRQLVIPANPQSQAQEDARNAQRCAAAGQRWLNATAEKRSGETMTDKELLALAAPAGQAWNGYYVQQAIGAGALAHAAAGAAWALLTAGEQTAWDNWAAARTPAIPSVHQTSAGGVTATPHTPGQTAFHIMFALAIAGVAVAPTATPPTYA